MNVYFGSVVYPAAMPYVRDFLESVKQQTYQGFILIILNDGVESKALESLFKEYDIRHEIISYEETFTPTQLRVLLLKEAKKRNADILVLGDIDDTFSPNRVESAIKKLKDVNDAYFVYNRFVLDDGKDAMPDLPLEITSYRAILEYNFLGLSNTAIMLHKLNEDFIDSLRECKSFVFDWYLFTRLLLEGYKGLFCKGSFTNYRLHEDNYIGLPSMTDIMVKKEMEVKKEHYRLLARYEEVYGILAKVYQNNCILRNRNKRKYYWWDLTRRKE